MKTNIDYQHDNVSAHCTGSVDSRRNRRIGISYISGGFMKRAGFFLAASFCIAMMSTLAYGQATFRSSATGNWNVAASWTLVSGTDADGIPDADDDAFVQSGHVITLTGNEAVHDLHISTGTTSATTGTDGRVALGANTLQVNGKLRSYFATVGTTPGTSSTTVPSTPITIAAASGGKVSFVGNSRSITISGEWGAGNTGSTTTFAVEINMNSGQTATMETSIKGSSWNIVAGTLDAENNRIAVDNGTTGQGDVTIATGATVISSATGTGGNAVIGRTGTTSGGTLTVNGTFILNGAAPTIAMSTINFNGTVTYSGSVAQITAVATNSGANPSIYTNLIINNSSGVTLGNSITVNGTLTLMSGNVTTNANTLTVGSAGAVSRTSGHVIGNLKKTTVPSTFTFDVGTANGYSPVTLSSVAGTGDFTVSATQAPLPGLVLPAKSLQRYWTLTNGGITSAILTFKYLDADVSGTEANYRIVKDNNGAGAPFTFPDNGADDVDESTNTATTTNPITSFSRWSLAEPDAPTAVKLRSFTASSYESGVVLEWQSGYEVDNLGYNIYRQQNGQRTRLTPSMVAGSALLAGERTVLTAGQSYRWFDRMPAGVGSVAYYLEDIDTNGKRTLHGPITPITGKVDRQQSAQALLLDQLPVDNTSRQTEWATASNEQQIELGKAATLSAATLTLQQKVAGMPGVKIMVRQSGWVRVTQPELVGAGLGQSVNPAHLQLYADGRQVPIKVSANGSQGQFTASDWIEFYARGLDTPNTDTRTYYLVVGTKAGLRILRSPYGVTPDDTQNGPQNFNYTVERKERSIYFPSLHNGDANNIFGQVISTTPVTSTLIVRHLDPTSPSARLRVTLQGVTAGRHVVNVQVNGVSAGRLIFNGQAHPTSVFTISPSLLREGENSVRMVAANGETDISLVDTLMLTYARTYVADNNRLQFSVNTTAPVSIDGFGASNVRIMDITNPYVVQELVPSVQPRNGAYTAKIQFSNAKVRTLLAFADTDHPASISRNEPSTLAGSNNGADFLIITHRDFRDHVQPLAELRRSQGLRVSVIDVEDVYDEFSYGARTPQALRDFIKRAAGNWQYRPHYVLLVGDSTWDPRNYMGQGEADFVPTRMIDTSYMETASDDWLADFNGDGVAEMAVGRLPVRTAAQADALVAKIVAYDSASSDPQRGALMVSDNGFEGSSSVVSALLPSTMPVQPINRSSADDATVRNQILTGINQGPIIINYIGHGSVGVWTGAGLLSSQDAAGLTNGNRLPLFVLMTCLNGYSHDAYIDSLGEAMLKAENGGAVAVWASSGFTSSGPQFVMNQQLYRSLFGGQGITLGDAIIAAKAATPDKDVRRTWTLLGDPTMKLR